MNLRHWNGLRTAFARMVYVLMQDTMAPFDCNTSDPKHLSFEDHTEQLQKEYTEGSDDCIRFPDGRILETSNYQARKFQIRNGKVVQRRAGPLKHPKVTRKCRKMKALPSYPRTKRYKSMADYAERGCGMVFNKNYNAYGYTFNPNGMWDFFSIGGRWPFAFLVKEDCEYSPGSYRWLLRNHQITTNTSYALISSSYPLEIPEAALTGYSFECYDDIDFDYLGRCLSPDAARRFAKAIQSNPHIDSWYFVCDGGCRRSAAIACAALRFWGYEKEEFKIWGNPRKEPNVWVFTLMSEALGLPIDDIDLDLRIHMNRSAIHSAFHNAP